MKAKIKATGEILKIADYAVIAMENCNNYGNPLEYSPEAVELIDDTPVKDNINWEQRRFELVKALAAGRMLRTDFLNYDKKSFVSIIVGLADDILAEYRKGGE